MAQEIGAEPGQPVMLVSKPVQFKAFSHPTRVRILELLIADPMTTKQLGDALGMSPAQAHYHLKFLERGGLVKQVFQREKAGVIEKYYRAASRKYVLTTSVGTFGEPGSVILETLSSAMLRGAVAAVSGAEVGLVFGVSERVTVPEERLGELLRIATLLQNIQEEFRGIGMGQGQEQGQAQAQGQGFELTLGLYAAAPEQQVGGTAGRGDRS